jgi:hypothetical protein
MAAPLRGNEDQFNHRVLSLTRPVGPARTVEWLIPRQNIAAQIRGDAENARDRSLKNARKAPADLHRNPAPAKNAIGKLEMRTKSPN